MQYFPLFVDTSRIRVLLVGAGEVASRKLDLLARTEAEIHVVAPKVSAEVEAYAASGRIWLSRRCAEERDLAERELVYLATADSHLNQTLASKARELGVWVNVVDTPSECDFITPSIVDRGRLVMAISTAGAAPVFARDLRAKLETLLPPSLSPLLDFIAEHREEVQQRLPSVDARRRFWEHFFKLNGDRFDASTRESFELSFASGEAQGELLLLADDCHLQLLPLAAMPMLQRIDSLITDAAPTAELLELIRRDASRTAPMADSGLLASYQAGMRMLRLADANEVARLKAAFPFAKHLRPGAI